jgi:hypothetical protein
VGEVFAYIIDGGWIPNWCIGSYYSEIERILAKKCKGKRWIRAEIDRIIERVFTDLPTI